ncbi:MAG: hypothetical protein ACYC61_15230 [Isosphaeraceae bacterium]
MLCTLKSILPFASQNLPRRRRHQFAPSITGSAANLEERTMLSGAGGAAVAPAAIDHAAIHHGADHHAMARHAAFPHHAQVRHAMAHHAAAARPAVVKREMRIEAQHQAAAAITTAAVAHDPVITAASAGGSSLTGIVTPGVIAGLPAETYNGYSTAAGTLPAGLQNSYVVQTGLGLGQPAVVAQFPINSTITRSYSSPLAGATIGRTGFTAVGGNNSALTSELARLRLLGNRGTTTATSSLTGASSQLFSSLQPFRSPVNPSPMPLNGSLPFTRSPVNPSPMPFNGTLPFTRSPINPSPMPFNGSLI